MQTLPAQIRSNPQSTSVAAVSEQCRSTQFSPKARDLAQVFPDERCILPWPSAKKPTIFKPLTWQGFASDRRGLWGRVSKTSPHAMGADQRFSRWSQAIPATGMAVQVFDIVDTEFQS